MTSQELVKINRERLNPCLKEQDLSYNCLDKNNYDQEKCEPFFENYKTCKTFWYNVSRHRRSLGIKPALPEPQDREQVKLEYATKNML